MTIQRYSWHEVSEDTSPYAWCRADDVTKLEAELAELRGLLQRANASADELAVELSACLSEAAKWKANHDNMVTINHLLRDRPDLGDRAKSVDALIEKNRALEAELAACKTRLATLKKESIINAIATLSEGAIMDAIAGSVGFDISESALEHMARAVIRLAKGE